VLLNITGGGRYRQRLDRALVPARPALELDEREILLDGTPDHVVSLFRSRTWAHARRYSREAVSWSTARCSPAESPATHSLVTRTTSA
jgi:hypothetical protein